MFSPELVKREIPLTLANDRIRGLCWFSFSDGTRSRQSWECVFDTGATRTLVPQRVWRTFAEQIDWVAGSDSLARGIGGQRIPSRDGVVASTWISSSSLETVSYSNCRLRFLFDDDAVQEGVIQENLRYLLIGLRGGILDRGGLCLNVRGQQVCLVLLSRSRPLFKASRRQAIALFPVIEPGLLVAA
jgi:hypothetical protein